MRIMVTGGAGFIGSAVCRHLVSKGEDFVLNLDALTYAGNLQSLTSIANHPNYTFLKADIREEESVFEAMREHQIDAVMHLAAESHVDRSIDGPDIFLETNVIGTGRMLSAARRYWDTLPSDRQETFRFHHVSTDEVYGDLPFDSGIFTEETPYQPSSPYSASKAASDHLVRAWFHTYGLPVVLSNCSNNYGPFHFPEKLIPLVTLNALEGRELPVYGKGENIRDWLFVEDHARALETVLKRGVPGETYNIGGRSERTNIDVVRAICAILDNERPLAGDRSYSDQIRFVTDRPGHDRRYAIDPGKIERELGWKPEQSFESGLEKTVRWFLDNAWWWEPIRKADGGERRGTIDAVSNKPLRIVVTGREGQVARALAERCSNELRYELIHASRPEFDFRYPEGLAEAIAALEPDLVVNAAAYTAVDKAESEPELAMTINAKSAGEIARGAALAGAPIVQISTDYVFDGSLDRPYREDDPVAPLGVYGKTKLAGENAVRDANPLHFILRTAWVYSPFGSNFVKTMLLLSETRDEISVVNDQYGNPTSAFAIADAILAVAEKLSNGGAECLAGTYHVAGRGSASWYEVAQAVFEIAGPHLRKTPVMHQISTTEYPAAAKRPLNSRLDNSLFERKFSWTAPGWPVSLQTTIERITFGRNPSTMKHRALK